MNRTSALKGMCVYVCMCVRAHMRACSLSHRKLEDGTAKTLSTSMFFLIT